MSDGRRHELRKAQSAVRRARRQAFGLLALNLLAWAAFAFYRSQAPFLFR